MIDSTEETNDIETFFQSQHFEAVPCADGYALVHRGTDNLACGRMFPVEVAGIALEALEQGYHLGARAMKDSLVKEFGSLASNSEHSLCGPMGGICRPQQRPKQK